MTTDFTMKAWITPYSFAKPDDISGPDAGKHISLSNHDMSDNGWTYVGDCHVTFTPISAAEIVDHKVQALRAEAANIRAEATAKCTRIEGQIQQLLCIENMTAESA